MEASVVLATIGQKFGLLVLARVTPLASIARPKNGIQVTLETRG
jgi:hypothetical protein